MNKIPYEVIFEDDYIIAINKPPGILTVQDRFNKLAENIHDVLSKYYDEILILHRLDKETSGLLLFAKNIEANRLLYPQFENHTTSKTYLTLVTGNIQNNEGIINAPLERKNQRENVMVVDQKNGKPSITNYKVIKRFSRFTLLEAYPKTGRTHQIRAHFKSINHPLAIDKLYSNKSNILLSDINPKFKQKNMNEKPLMERLTLHALSLEFTHPGLNRRMKLEAPVWKDFKVLIKNLEKYS